MRKAFIALFVAALALTGIATTAQATPAGKPPVAPVAYTDVIVPLNATNGFHNHTFYSCTVDNRRARNYIKYEVFGGNAFRLAETLYETDWNSHPAFDGNAVRLDLEADAGTNPGLYTEVSPAWGGSSTTLDDMPSYYHQIYIGDTGLVFQNTSNPQLRMRFYGVGAGSVGGRCDDQTDIE